MSMDLAKRQASIVQRGLKELSLHPASKLIPASRAEASERFELTPLEILADGRILVGRDRFERAVKSRQKEVPTVVVQISDDGAEMYVIDRALQSHYLSDDQRVALAIEYAARLSAKMRSDRAKRAAAVRYGRAATRSTGANKQDARAEACERFRIAPKKFRQLRRLVRQQPALYQNVLDGKMSLKQARQSASREEVTVREATRSANAPTTVLPEFLLGDARQLIATLPNNHFSALITDPPYGVDFQQEWRGQAEIAIVGDKDVREAIPLFRAVLAAAGPKMRADSLLWTFVPAKYESEFRLVVIEQGWSIIGYPIWVKNTRVLYPHVNIASQHERMLIAIRGNAKLRKPISDVFRHGKTRVSSHPCQKPQALLAEIIQAVSVEGECILDPFSGSGSTVLAAIGCRRQAVGIELCERWHGEAIKQLSEAHLRRSVAPKRNR